jgi:WD40 repeat protein
MRRELSLWDAADPEKPLKTLLALDRPGEARPPGVFPMLAISPDGKFVACAWFRETTVNLFSGETGEPLEPIDAQTELTALALGSDGQLATAGNREVRLWDVDTRTPMPSLTPNQSFVRLLRFSPRGSLLAMIGQGSRDVELWDTAAHAVVAALPTLDPIDDLAFSPNGVALAASTRVQVTPTNARAANTLVWSLPESSVQHRLGGFDTETRSLAFRSDGLLALGSFKGTVRFWDSDHSVYPQHTPAGAAAPAHAQEGAGAGADSNGDRAPAKPREPDDSSPREGPALLAFDDLGRLVTVVLDRVQVWADPPKCPKGGVQVELPEFGGGPFRGLNWPVLASSRDGHVMVLARGLQVFLWRSSNPGRLEAVFSPPGLGPMFGRGRPGRFDGANRPDSSARPENPPRPGRFPGAVAWRALAISPSGDRLYLADVGRLHAWALEGTRARSLNWAGGPADLTSLALRPDGRLLAVGSRTGGVVTLIDTETGVTVARLAPRTVEGDGAVRSLAFSPDGLELAAGTEQGHINLWSLKDTSAPPLRLPGRRRVVAALAYDPAGRHLASAGSDKTVDVWNLDRLRDEFRQLGLAR